MSFHRFARLAGSAIIGLFALTGTASAVPYSLEVTGGGLSLLLENLELGGSDRDDFYEITTPQSGDVTVTMQFDGAVADLDLRIFDAGENFIGVSQGVGSLESATFAAEAGMSYFIVSYLFGSAPGGDPDPFDPNDSFGMAAAISTPVDPIPLPAAFPLFLAGLGGMALFRRRVAAA